jgi:hypothetical protein
MIDDTAIGLEAKFFELMACVIVANVIKIPAKKNITSNIFATMLATSGSIRSTSYF